MLLNVKKLLKDNRLWLILALGLGLLLLLLPRKQASAEPERQEALAFSLEAEEKRIAAALSKLDGAGNVTVVLTLDRSEEREYARNLDSDRQTETDGGRTEERSEIAEIGDGALTVKVLYPRYRGALVVVEGDGSALRLEVTQAVSALTGLSSDKITVIRGSR